MSQIKTSSGVAIVYHIQFTNPAIQQFLDVQGTTICKRPKTKDFSAQIDVIKFASSKRIHRSEAKACCQLTQKNHLTNLKNPVFINARKRIFLINNI